MKKLLGIVVLGLLWCNVGVADIKLLKKYSDGKLIEITEDSSKEDKRMYFGIHIVCVDGLKFLMGTDADLVDVTQMLGADGKPLTCSMD